ncbi:GyrI-like domain-containing protein [Nocardioides sp. R-C-SC26]|uniref:GyrI-like domain-containing protein n=1 Tax=Nocardioides sp. R-C-SC26 TaxID=2870414 RepID=UPI001E4C0839|nr:GyrI-like domain-containing protein [Nocardioides sp. R-C-SC26]
MSPDVSPAGKVDLRRSIDGYRARAGQFRILDMPRVAYLMVDGRGDPNTAPRYADALASLYPVAYTLKFASKGLGRDYVVPPLEALWWAEDMTAFTSARDKSAWSWTVMLLCPEWITSAMVDDAVGSCRAKRDVPPLLDDVRFASLDEGTCVQTLHLGPYDDEGPVLAELHGRFIPQHGLAMSGRHHEIYLNDARRTDPAKLRTILRQPVVRTDD